MRGSSSFDSVLKISEFSCAIMKFSVKRACRTSLKIAAVVTILYVGVTVNMRDNPVLQQLVLSEADLRSNEVHFANSSGSSNVELESPDQPPEYEHLVDMINERADSDGYILLAMTDEAFLDMAINFHEASLRAHNVDNFLFVGIGRKTCETLSDLSIPCFYYADDPSAGKASSYGQRDFKRKMNLRTDMILETLAANFTVIHSDIDIAFLGNPVPHVKVNAASVANSSMIFYMMMQNIQQNCTFSAQCTGWPKKSKPPPIFQ